jgi:hypothetical protein
MVHHVLRMKMVDHHWLNSAELRSWRGIVEAVEVVMMMHRMLVVVVLAVPVARYLVLLNQYAPSRYHLHYCC